MSIVLRELEWSQIYSIWRKNLWPNRTTPIETHSAMLYKGGHDMENFRFKVDFLGCFKDNKLIGVNSGHKTMDGGYRSRGLWVHPDHRGQGIGQILLKQIIQYRSNSFFVWSYPRQTSWNTYKAVGFQLASDWKASDTSEANAYCILHR